MSIELRVLPSQNQQAHDTKLKYSDALKKKYFGKTFVAITDDIRTEKPIEEVFSSSKNNKLLNQFIFLLLNFLF
jgi:hypothetical protein